LSVAFRAIEKLKQAPVYVVQKILVCLNCGAALTPYHRIVLMTLYATGVRNAEVTQSLGTPR
jgi:hypothetical protein